MGNETGKCGICGKEGFVADEATEQAGRLAFEHGLVTCDACAEEYGLHDGTDLTLNPECPHCGWEFIRPERFVDRELVCQCCGAEFFVRAVTVTRYLSIRKGGV